MKVGCYNTQPGHAEDIMGRNDLEDSLSSELLCL